MIVFFTIRIKCHIHLFCVRKLNSVLRTFCSNTRTEIEEKLDVKLFDQMIRNNAFSYSDFEKVVCYIFELCIKFGSPQRDKATAEMRDELLNEIKRNSPFSVIIPIFIENVNTCVDHIYEDLQTTLRNIDKKNNSNHI